MKPTLFVADLHLCRARPDISLAFFRFLTDTAPGAQALYILGDLFEYWAGDDDLADPFNAEVAGALAALGENGVAVALMHGNRDFLLGEVFARASGTSLLPDPSLIDLYGTPTLLMHGDTLCTADRAYMEFRIKVRDPLWQQAFLARPLEEREAIIQGMRRESAREQAHKEPDILDVSPDAVAAALRRHHYPRLIHGHTHRPARHSVQVDGRTCERWVLPAWYGRGGYLRCDPSGCHALPA